MCCLTPTFKNKSRTINLTVFQLPSGNDWELLMGGPGLLELLCLFSTMIINESLKQKDPKAYL